jgi:hypothetical protein|tara:strand:- start:884 stop:1489 length:606 start_codon:yes stop_codon:yes gene_type:complete
MSDFGSMNTTQLMIEANRLRKKLKKRRGGFGFDNTTNAVSRLFGGTGMMGQMGLAGQSVAGAIGRKLSKSRDRYSALMAELKKRKGSGSQTTSFNEAVTPENMQNVGVSPGQDPNAAFTTSSNVTQPLMPQMTNQQQIQPGEIGNTDFNDGTENEVQPFNPNVQKGFISPTEQFGSINTLNPMMPPNPFDPDSTGINSLYN